MARRAVAHRLADALPEPKIVTAKLVIGEAVYDVPAPVAQFVMRQQGVIVAQASALDAADSLLAKFRVERAADDSLDVARERENVALRDAVRRAQRQSRWDRVAEWGVRGGIAYAAYKIGQATR